MRVKIFVRVQDANLKERYVHVHPLSINLLSHRVFDPGALEGLPSNHNRYVTNNMPMVGHLVNKCQAVPTIWTGID